MWCVAGIDFKTKSTLPFEGGAGFGCAAGEELEPLVARSSPQGSTSSAPLSNMPPLLDLAGLGLKISELSRWQRFVDSEGDGLLHRTAWAGAGNAVLFFDPDGRNAITENRQYIFTEWDPTAKSDLDALRSAFDTDGDGKLDAGDAAFSQFKLEVTNADGSTSILTLAQAGIVFINVTVDATHITLPDGSVITSQAIVPRPGSCAC